MNLTAIDFFLLRRLIELRLYVEGLYYKFLKADIIL